MVWLHVPCSGRARREETAFAFFAGKEQPDDALERQPHFNHPVGIRHPRPLPNVHAEKVDFNTIDENACIVNRIIINRDGVQGER